MRPTRIALLAVLVVAVAVLLVRLQPLVGSVVVVLGGLAVGVPLARGRRSQWAGRDDSRRRTAAAIAAAHAEQAERELAAGRTAGLTGRQFEQFVAGLLERSGCEDVRVVGGAGDRGADVTAISPSGHRVVVQCKRYGPGNPVRDPEIQRFLGTVYDEHRAEVALFVTTGVFTRAAAELGTRRGLVLVDGDQLGRWISGEPAASPLPPEPREVG